MNADLTSPEGALRNFMRVRASTDGTDSYTWFAGTVYAWEPTGKSAPLFGIEGFNVARTIEAEGGYDLCTREAAFYLDPRTRAPLDRWTNPWTEREVDVVHVFNDPVNFRFRPQMPWGPFRAPHRVMGEEIFFTSDVFLAYPSPLPRAEYPDNSQDDTYKAAELFGFSCRVAEIDGDAPDVPARVSWTRLAPWLPFMGMADRPGMLVYHCEGAKVAGFDALGPLFAERVPERFRTAPDAFTQPNETSWTYFRKQAAS